MQEDRHFQVRVEGVRFAAAHFATFGGACEPLHGHSYEVCAEVDGTLTEDAWVIDFIELKALLRSFCKELDHRFILQRDSRVLTIEAQGSTWSIKAPSGLDYTFPAQDVIALPVDNTTAERLAEWLCERTRQALIERGANGIESLTVEVWEGPGQRASHKIARLPVK